jgi:hypothetical protein
LRAALILPTLMVSISPVGREEVDGNAIAIRCRCVLRLHQTLPLHQAICA